MIDKAKFNAYQLRIGDYCLVQTGKEREQGIVILRGKTYLSAIIVRLESGREINFNSKTKCPYRIVAGARQVGGNWIAL